MATQPQHEYIGKYQNLNLRLVFPPAKCFRAVLPMASYNQEDAICTTHPFPSKTATCAAASLCHGRCDAAELQCLYEPQMLALQPTCFRSHAVKRLLARKLWPAWSAVLLSSPCKGKLQTCHLVGGYWLLVQACLCWAVWWRTLAEVPGWHR